VPALSTYIPPADKCPFDIVVSFLPRCNKKQSNLAENGLHLTNKKEWEAVEAIFMDALKTREEQTNLAETVTRNEASSLT